MLTDIEIAQKAKMLPIEIAASLGLDREEIELYGNYKAKINDNAFERLKDKSDGKLVLVTAINPTPAGGKDHRYCWLGTSHAENRQEGHNCVKRTLFGPVMGIRWGGRWWILSGSANGGHKPAFYR